jgi:hypothetical protein
MEGEPMVPPTTPSLGGGRSPPNSLIFIYLMSERMDGLMP